MTTYCPLSHTFCHFVLALKLLSGDRWKIFRAANNESLNKHKILKDSLCDGGHLGTWPIPVHKIVYLAILLHFSSITLRMGLALNSHYLFMVVAKPFAVNKNVKSSVSIVPSRCPIFHDDVIKWKPFPRCWPFVRGIHRSPVNSLHKGQWRGALMFFICAWINNWVNNGEAGGLRRHRAHYHVTVMFCRKCIKPNSKCHQ